MKIRKTALSLLGLGLLFSVLASGCHRDPEPDKTNSDQNQTQKQLRKEKRGD